MLRMADAVATSKWAVAEFDGNRITNTCAAHYKVTLDAQSKAVFFTTIDEHKARNWF